MHGSRVGSYRILDTLGVGGMGTVYRARVEEAVGELEIGREVAVKVLHGQLIEQPTFFARFRREAQVGRRVSHANVVRSYDLVSHPWEGRIRHLLVMELVHGQTLRGLLEEFGVVPEELCVHIGQEVTKALEAIHAANVVHRDLKPENVMITQAHEVKVMDLGIAFLQDEVTRLSRTGAFVGSIEYAAPEQFSQALGPVDGRADLHALGLVLYELATGRHPFRKGSMPETLRSVLEGKVRPAVDLNPELSACFGSLLQTLLAHHPKDRLASATEARAVLDEGESSTWWRARLQSVGERRTRPLRRPTLPRDTALHGREAELDQLRAAFQEAAAGSGRVVLLEGEAGIGKTRLVDELAARLRADGESFELLFGSYPPGGAATAAGAFSTAYREHFGADGIESALERHLTITPALVPAFAALLRGDLPPQETVPLTKDSLQTVFVHVTRALAARTPIIVFIDDLHFAPEEGRALFSALATSLEDARVVLLGAMRPGVDPSWVAGLTELPTASVVPLSRLGPKDLANLLEDAFQSRRLARELSHVVSLKSDGNPFFTFEILRDLKEKGMITQDAEGHWVSRGRITDVQVPSSVLDLVEARMCHLTEDERNLLDVAACCGFEFDPCLVADVAEMPRIPALKGLARMERRHRLVRAAGRHYVFDHHQVQEALLAHLMPQLRLEYHRGIADAITASDEATEPNETTLDGATCVDVCHQYLMSHRGAAALEYLEPALTHLEGGYQNEQAIDLTRSFLEEKGLLTDAPRVKLLWRQANLLERLGRHAERGQALEEAQGISVALGDPPLQAQALTELAGLQRHLGDVESAEQGYRRALDFAREIDRVDLAASAILGLGNTFAVQGRYEEARTLLEEGLDLQRRPPSSEGSPRTLGNLAAVLYSLGEADRALSLFEEQLERCIASGDVLGEETVHGNLGLALSSRGRLVEAREHCEKALHIAREIGDRQGEAYLQGTLGNLDDRDGRTAEGLVRHERALVLHRETGHLVGQAMATGSMGTAQYGLGKLAAARETLARCLELCRACSDRYLELLCLNAQARIDIWLGEHDLARSRLEEARKIGVEMGAPVVHAEVLHTLSDAERHGGKIEEAAAHAEEALRLLRTEGPVETTPYAYMARARARRAAGDDAGAREDLRHARDDADAMDNLDNQLRARAHLLDLGEGDAEDLERRFDALSDRVGAVTRLELGWLLWKATACRRYLDLARHGLEHLREHAPAERRDAMIEQVPLLAAIHAATTRPSPS